MEKKDFGSKGNNYRVGIIGCGRVSTMHAGGYSRLPETKLVAAADTIKNALHTFSEKWGVNQLYTDYNEMLEKEKLDIVSICTMNSLHCEMTIAAVESGVKAIICEKPIAMDLNEADQMIRACDKAGVKLAINHQSRVRAAYLRVKQHINDGTIGELRALGGHTYRGMPKTQPRWWARYEYAGGGWLMVNGTHLLDTFRFFSGDVDWVFGHVERKNKDTTVEDMAIGCLHFKNGVYGFIETSALTNYYSYEMYLQGSNGKIWMLDEGDNITKLWTCERNREDVKTFNIVDGFGTMETPLTGMIKELIECLKQDREHVSSGQQGRATLELIMAIYESARRGGSKVTFPLDVKENPLGLMLRKGQI